jgi:hypothetical protein
VPIGFAPHYQRAGALMVDVAGVEQRDQTFASRTTSAIVGRQASAWLKVPLVGGSSSTLATGQSNPGALVVDGSSLYYTKQDPGDAAAAVVSMGD